MFPTKELFYGSAIAMIHGLKEEFKAGLRPRDVVFCALDPRGDVHICVPKRMRDVKGLKVGEKLGLPPTLEGRRYHLDAVHPVGGDAVVINGDRRIGNISSLVDVAALVSWFVKEAEDKSIFFGCTPHQPGSWWVSGEQAIALHTKGFVEIVVAEQGLLARRIMDDGLFFLPKEAAVQGGVEQWQRVYTSPLGNVLMLERRLLYDQLVLSCQGGLVEVDLYDLPKISEAGRFTLPGGFAVVGRITNGAFAVARGTPMDWGFEDLEPAQLVGSVGCSFMELREQLRAQA
jgi:hypothetical protein